MAEALDSYSAKKRITTSQAIRQFIEKGLSITSYEQSQTEIRNYIREEIETVMPIVMKRYMERLIAMQAVAARTSAAALQCCVSVLAENYIDRLHEASNQVFWRGDLSKEQIRELLLKKQDKENTAEM